MPFEGEQFDELLSGYLDEQLSEAERAQVESALSSDPAARQRLDELRQLSVQLRELRDVRSTESPAFVGGGFAKAIVEEAQRKAAVAGLPATHHVRRSRQHTAVPATAGRWTVVRGLTAAAALAAAILLAIYLPSWLAENSNGPGDQLANQPLRNTNQPGGESTEAVQPSSVEDESPAVETHYVGDTNFQIQYTLVVDMTVSAAAIDNGYISSVLATSGIKLQDPIVASDQLQETLAEARMTVSPAEEGAGSALIYFVHADTVAVAQAIEAFFSDLTNVPELRFDIAFDTPINKLMKRIAESTGKRFAVDDSIVAPVTLSPTERVSPFAGIRPQGHLVSSNQRIQPKGDTGPAGMGLVGEGSSTVLLLVRVLE